MNADVVSSFVAQFGADSLTIMSFFKVSWRLQLGMELRLRIKQRLQLIFIKESNTMQIARIYVQDDARRHFCVF
jgi:hypothetical protein